MKRLLLAGALVLASPGVAGAATVDVAGLDDGNAFRFTPPDATAAVGDSVNWGFASAAVPHNVNVVAPGVDPAAVAAHELLGVAPPAAPVPLSKVLDRPGVWLYYCSFHGGLDPGGMSGRVVVGDVVPPPPVDTGPAAQPNAVAFSGPLEEGDSAPPALTKVGALGGRRSVRVRFVLGEPARVTVASGGRSVGKTFKRGGVGTLTLARLKRGRRTVTVRATDAAGLSTARTLKATVR